MLVSILGYYIRFHVAPAVEVDVHIGGIEIKCSGFEFWKSSLLDSVFVHGNRALWTRFSNAETERCQRSKRRVMQRRRKKQRCKPSNPGANSNQTQAAKASGDGNRIERGFSLPLQWKKEATMQKPSNPGVDSDQTQVAKASGNGNRIGRVVSHSCYSGGEEHIGEWV